MPDFNNITVVDDDRFDVQRPERGLGNTTLLGGDQPGDGAAPVVAIIGPAAGSPIDALTPLVFEVTDNVALGMVIVALRFQARGIEEVVHNGQRFSAQYDGSSTRFSIAGGFRFTVLRNGGWVDAPTLDVYAVDAVGTGA